MKTNIKKMTLSALLIALSILIPLVLGNTPLKIYIPPFSATIGSHVPMFLAMLLGPFEAVVVGIGSVIGFLFAMGDPIIALRAATHIVVGYMGAKMFQKQKSYKTVVALTAPLHGILEGLVVFLFIKDSAMVFVVITIVGTIAHHIADALITWPIIKAIQDATHINLSNIGEKEKNKSKDIAV